MARQYNLKNLNGIHLKAPYDYTSYSTDDVSALIQDYDFHPYRSNDLSDFEFINGSYNLVDKTSPFYGKPMGDGFIGDNSKATRTIAVDYTQFKKNNTLVKGEIYYTKFDMYFNFNGDGQNYEVDTTGYTINVDIYAIIGNNKKKLKLSNLMLYNDVPTSNPDSNLYADISGSIFEAWVNITGDTINASYLPIPHRYDILKDGGGDMAVSWIEGTVSDPDYTTTKIQTFSGSTAINIISFKEPLVTDSDPFTPAIYTVQDQGIAEAPSNFSPFNLMSGYMFKVTAELDVSTEELFNSNICTGNKDFKIMVDYNGRISQTTVGYVFDEIAVEDDGSGPPPSE